MEVVKKWALVHRSVFYGDNINLNASLMVQSSSHSIINVSK